MTFIRHLFFLSVFVLVGNGLIATTSYAAAASDGGWTAGFARVDITPTEPVRMTGYGNRDRPSEGVDTPLYVRAIALRHSDEPVHLLLAVDNIGLSGELTRELAQQLKSVHGVTRERVVLSSTHTHCAPDLVSGLDNIFATELSDLEVSARQRYTDQLEAAVLKAVGDAITDLAPARLAHAQGEIGFAANRRVLNDGRWVNFGVQPDGPVDHSVPVIGIMDIEGELRGAIFNYACHCTTLGGEHYRINADWAGYATSQIEKSNPGCIALCMIGCGADANPEPRGTDEMSQLHGLALATEVSRLLSSPMQAINTGIESNFDYAGLSFELPTMSELELRAQDKSPQTRRNAEYLQAVYKEHGRLPATYPVPIQSWQFGDDLTMVFLGGEVVVDYALRLKNELESPNLWVSAYCNDVLGYICSERMRGEGGYEYDRSAIYYNLPGPWATGTEDLLIRRIHEMLDTPGRASPLAPDAALRSIHVPEGFEIQLVAAEPLVKDPINLAFGADGKLWVVEMGDYPGDEATSIPLGRIKYLTDSDGDGTFDSATTFLDGIAFPTGVHPWKDGVIVCAAPEIFFARDIDGDGKADERETWYSGFPLANPQHRINGFTYALEHALHCASGDNLGELRAVRTGETVNASGRDVRIWPTTGKLDLLSGRTQYIRSRNDWGESFGNDNSRPMYHYPIEDRYLARNSSVRYSGNQQFLFSPPSAPPVFPLSNTVDRFNDLFAANRFTSACSAIVFRSNALGDDVQNAAFICEPVHNLVHRAMLVPNDASYQATRHPSETQSEFLASTDPWFRPVRVLEGTDGMLWVVDMYRAVIEHPEWIPLSWQQQIDLRAGEDCGRIYRVVPAKTKAVASLPTLAAMTPQELAGQLENESGAVRDLAQQLLLSHDHALDAVDALLQMAQHSKSPQARVHALWCLDSLGRLNNELLETSLHDDHFGVLRSALVLGESRLAQHPELLNSLARLADHADPRVRLQLALSLGESRGEAAGQILASLVDEAAADAWLRRAIVTSSPSHVPSILHSCLTLLQNASSKATRNEIIELISDLITTASRDREIDVEKQIAVSLRDAPKDAAWVLPLTTAWLKSHANESKASESVLTKSLHEVYGHAIELAQSSDANESQRCQAIGLFGHGLASKEQECSLLASLISPRVPLPVQLVAIERLGAIGDLSSAEFLVAQWPTFSVRVRDAAIGEMLRIPAWTSVLLAAIGNQAILPKDLTPATRQQLQSTGNQSTKALARRLLGDDSKSDRGELVARYLAELADRAESNEGRIERGTALFNRLCAACHTPDDSGRLAGPNLGNLTDRSTRALTEAILDPNRAVDPQYRSYSVLLEDGRTLSGVIAEEAGESLTLVHPDAKRTTISRAEIEELRNTGLSLMPLGFELELTPEKLDDLIHYIRSGLSSK